MKPLTHLFASAIIAAALYPMFGWKAILVVASGFLIDIDHYLWYIFKHKNINIIDCYQYYIDGLDKEKYKKNLGILLIFHTIEFLLIMTALSFYSDLFLLFTIGLLAHYLLDLIAIYNLAGHLIANHSVINWLLNNKIEKASKI
ncbi:hypothetical protein HYX02_03080 [Candidatus Woesearchaeota archaeon]|nr:hypothetical protein [Candidatus Woesearchaeota archaeon]